MLTPEFENSAWADDSNEPVVKTVGKTLHINLPGPWWSIADPKWIHPKIDHGFYIQYPNNPVKNPDIKIEDLEISMLEAELSAIERKIKEKKDTRKQDRIRKLKGEIEAAKKELENLSV